MSELLYFCPVCHAGFATWEEYTTHRETAHFVNPYTCALCGAAFSSMAELDAHYRDIHHEYVETVPVTTFICYVCLAEFGAELALQNHLADVHGILPENWVRCPICSAIFSSQANLESHIAGTHQSGPTPPPPDLPPTLPPEDPTWTPTPTVYTCPICFMTFTNTVDLNAHYFAVHTKPPTTTPTPTPGRACMITFLLAPIGLRLLLPAIRVIRDRHIPRIIQTVYYGLSAKILYSLPVD